MKVSEYLVSKIKEYGVTDVFGIPGGVVLDFIYEIDKTEDIDIHLNYHEQAAAYAGCGYAHASGRLGVAYATKGPGFTNMFTAIAEAYYDSLPVLFVTAHSQKVLNDVIRIEGEQEVNHVELAQNITKYAKRIDDTFGVDKIIDEACAIAMEGRKGPVLLDFYSKVLKSEIELQSMNGINAKKMNEEDIKECIEDIKSNLSQSKRPVFLIGDGLRGSGVEEGLMGLSEKVGIPILSSRFSQDIVYGSKMYCGYIGSHGLRYSNFILSKTDCIIALGNRMAFQIESESFRPIVENAKVIRIDADNAEFIREIPNSISYCIDIRDLVSAMLLQDISYLGRKEWIETCNRLKEELKLCDVTHTVTIIASLFRDFDKNGTIVCDIGNNELWSSRAYALSGNGRKMLHSKSLKTVGSSIGKAIGAYYVKQKPIMCITGDQGFMFNIQELQYIVDNQLPITIVICNNNASGMLKNNESQQGYKYSLHTTMDSGYSHPDFEKIAKSYDIKYTSLHDIKLIESKLSTNEPEIIEIFVDEGKEKMPYLPKGNPCQKFVPELEGYKYDYLNNL